MCVDIFRVFSLFDAVNIVYLFKSVGATYISFLITIYHLRHTKNYTETLTNYTLKVLQAHYCINYLQTYFNTFVKTSKT